MPFQLTDSQSAIQKCLQEVNLPPNLTLRRLEAQDYHLGFLDCLSELTHVGDISPEQFHSQFTFIQARPDEYFIFVLEDEKKGRVVGCCTLMVERKFIRNCGLVGHVEDVCLRADMRGMSLGRHLVEFCCKLAGHLGCYKVILDCKETMIPFYQKCSLAVHGVQMASYFGGAAKVASNRNQ